MKMCHVPCLIGCADVEADSPRLFPIRSRKLSMVGPKGRLAQEDTSNANHRDGRCAGNGVEGVRVFPAHSQATRNLR